MISVEKFWHSIEDWDQLHPFTSESILSQPATDMQILFVKSVLAVDMPDNLVKMLKRHNGAGHGWYCFSEGNFLSTDEIVSLYTEVIRLRREIFHDEYLEHIQSVGPVKVDQSWREGWIPFLKRNKVPLCIDLDPAPGGTVGQVVEVDIEAGQYSVLAMSLEDFLQNILDEIYNEHGTK